MRAGKLVLSATALMTILIGAQTTSAQDAANLDNGCVSAVMACRASQRRAPTNTCDRSTCRRISLPRACTASVAVHRLSYDNNRPAA